MDIKLIMDIKLCIYSMIGHDSDPQSDLQPS